MPAYIKLHWSVPLNDKLENELLKAEYKTEVSHVHDDLSWQMAHSDQQT